MSFRSTPSIKRRGDDYSWLDKLEWKITGRQQPMPPFKGERVSLPFTDATYSTVSYNGKVRERRTLTYTLKCNPTGLASMRSREAQLIGQFHDMVGEGLRDSMLMNDDQDDATSSDYWADVDFESVEFTESPTGLSLEAVLTFSAAPLTKQGCLL